MLVKKIMDRNESCLIYTEYEDSIERLQFQLSRYAKWAGVKKIMVLSGKQKEEERVLIENELGPRDVVIVSQAARQSRNLQAANHVIMYNIPFSIGTVTQLIGRVCRMDSKYDSQWIHIIESENTIDTYKKKLFQDNVYLINQLFGNMGTLPTDIFRVDRNNLTALKRQLLWNKRK